MVGDGLVGLPPSDIEVDSSSCSSSSLPGDVVDDDGKVVGCEVALAFTMSPVPGDDPPGDSDGDGVCIVFWLLFFVVGLSVELSAEFSAVGDSVGFSVVGPSFDFSVGEGVGFSVDSSVCLCAVGFSAAGFSVGFSVVDFSAAGSAVGLLFLLSVGEGEGFGFCVGFSVRFSAVGFSVGFSAVGVSVGFSVGFSVGKGVGSGVDTAVDSLAGFGVCAGAAVGTFVLESALLLLDSDVGAFGFSDADVGPFAGSDADDGSPAAVDDGAGVDGLAVEVDTTLGAMLGVEDFFVETLSLKLATTVCRRLKNQFRVFFFVPRWNVRCGTRDACCCHQN